MRHIHRLSARKVTTETRPGLHADGRQPVPQDFGRQEQRQALGLPLSALRLDGKRCEIGFGGAIAVSLARARQKAAEARACLADGRDPRVEMHDQRHMPTFGEVADALMFESLRPSWRNAKHRAQWDMTLREYAKPLRQRPVNDITTADVLAVLRPIWQTKPETASRVRGRIEKVLDASKAQGFRSGENPAAWRGHLALILPPRQKLSRGHHARLPDR